MSTIYESTFDGERNITRGQKAAARDGETDLAVTLQESADDFALILLALQTLADKIDADSGDTGGDSDYRAVLDGVVTSADIKTVRG